MRAFVRNKDGSAQQELNQSPLGFQETEASPGKLPLLSGVCRLCASPTFLQLLCIRQHATPRQSWEHWVNCPTCLHVRAAAQHARSGFGDCLTSAAPLPPV